MMCHVLILFLLFIYDRTLCIEHRINNVNEFIAFSNSVNDGTAFWGTTVYLNDDIDFSGGYSGQFVQIGCNKTNYFNGTFDGQGHVISNLVLNSSLEYTGIFGYSRSTCIQNTVIDGSCSFISLFNSEEYNSVVGSIMGQCSTLEGPCLIKNIVNNGLISFEGDTIRYMYAGGIIGVITSSFYESVIKNCVNYGSVTHSGTCGKPIYLGGIIGSSGGERYANIRVQNCLNYGSVVHNGTSSYIIIGGFTGYGWSTFFDNCVSFGKVLSNTVSEYIGAIAGIIDAYTEVTHCYWSENINYGVIGYEYFGSIVSNNSIFNPTTFELNEVVTVGNYIGSSLIYALNTAADYYSLRGYSHWLLNKGGKDVSFTVNGNKLNFAMSSQIILLPSLASGENTVFDGWYTSSACTTLLADFIVDGRDLSLYGKSEENTNSYTIAFDTRGGTPINSVTQQYGTVVTLPKDTTKDHCEFLGWETGYGDIVPDNFAIPARNIILYAVWLYAHITTVEELIAFSNDVNNGRSYSGITVSLDSDIDFSGGYSNQFPPIGYTISKYFSGTFDGQGHVISNLMLNSSLIQHIGLFGFSEGITIKNVVIGNSCFFVSSYGSDGHSPIIGGITGRCNPTNSLCTIENSVNMANLMFEGDTNYNMFIGGVIGYLESPTYSNIIKNCANYGSLIHSGECGESIEIGGVVGIIKGSSSAYNYIQNCLNYGTIICNGTSNSLAVGGIIGNSIYVIIDNCINSGLLILNKKREVGIIIGNVESSSKITHCYWTSNVGKINVCSGNKKDVAITNSSIVEFNKTILYELNEYAEKNSTWKKWAMLHLNGGKINNISQESLVIIHKVFPDPAKDGHTFVSWCTDAECETQYDPEIDAIIELYAEWVINNYTLVFDFNNGTTVDKNYTFNTSIEYPKGVPEKEGYTLTWSSNFKFMPGNDTVITLQWVPKNYIVTFDFNNGTAINKSFSFNTSINYPKVEKEGFILNEWHNKYDYMPANNIIITAQWIPNNYTVTFDFGNETTLIENFSFSSIIEYPNIEREGYSLIWDNNIDYMPAWNIIIKALWLPNNFTVILNTNGGSKVETQSKIIEFNSAYGTLPIPTRTGYIFVGWFTEKNKNITDNTIFNTPNNQTLYAQWIINNYTLTFIFSNGTDPDVRILHFNESIVYPKNLTRENYTFNGWDNEGTIEFMPARNLTVTALWTPIPPAPVKSKSSSNTGAIVGGVLGSFLGIVVIALAVLLLLFLLLKKKENEKGDGNIEVDINTTMMERRNPRIVEKSYAFSGVITPGKSIEDSIAKFYSNYYRVPTISEALYQAGLSKGDVDGAVEACSCAGDYAVSEGKLLDRFTKEDAEALALYTFDFGLNKYDINPYRIINSALASNDENELCKASGLLFVVMSALRKLPMYTGGLLYRGVREAVDMNLYKEGSTVVWKGLSSTSPDMKATKAFLDKNPNSENKKGTLFVIESGWGYDIQPYSLFPDEAEILLEPERRFIVQNVIAANPTIVNLQMIDTPVILPQVFGGAN